MSPSRHATIVLVVILLVFAPASVRAAEPSIDLDGTPISVEEAAALSCHDLLVDRVTCFRTSAEMEAAVHDLVRRATMKGLAVAATGYVVVYEDAWYGGSSRTLSVDYANLASIGWNDRISSFKSFGATGHFREHANPPSGFTYSYGSSSQVSYVGSSYNDKFSYFHID